MKAKDLRIKNWIHYKVGHVDQDIQLDFVLFRVLEVFPERFKPIPLTDDWFKEFGFTHEPWGWSYGAILVRSSKELYYIEMGNNLGIQLPYVHTLQNFFTLAGQELEIKEILK